MNYFKCLSSGYIPYPFTCSTGNRNIKSIFEFTSYFFLNMKIASFPIVLAIETFQSPLQVNSIFSLPDCEVKVSPLSKYL